MVKLIKKIAGKFGVEIRRYPQECVSLKPKNGYLGNVLLSYIMKPFMLRDGEPKPGTQSDYWESWQIAKTFLNFNYAVDIINYYDDRFMPKKDYSFFIGACTNFQRIARLLNKDCFKILHLDTAHWLFSNSAAYKRSLALQKRRGVALQSFNWVDPNRAFEHADCATILGNDFAINTYQYKFKYARKLIYRIPASTCAVHPWSEEKDYKACRKSFLWLGSTGLVHKGLDLVLEAFSEMPDYHLTVCGPIQKEKDFENAYYKELYQTPNIHTIGWIDVSGPEFTEFTNKCVGLIYPSCSEGEGRNVIDCMHAGLIPIVSYESSVDVHQDYGVVLKDCSIEEIKSSIDRISSLDAKQLKQMSRKAWEFARANHTRKKFAQEYRKFAEKVVDHHQMWYIEDGPQKGAQIESPMTERRKLERFDLILSANIQVLDRAQGTGEEKNTLFTRDVCAGGAFLQTATPLTKGTQVKIDLNQDFSQSINLKGGSPPIRVQGTVLRSEPHGMAIGFDKKCRIIQPLINRSKSLQDMHP